MGRRYTKAQISSIKKRINTILSEGNSFNKVAEIMAAEGHKKIGIDGKGRDASGAPVDYAWVVNFTRRHIKDSDRRRGFRHKRRSRISENPKSETPTHSSSETAALMNLVLTSKLNDQMKVKILKGFI